MVSAVNVLKKEKPFSGSAEPKEQKIGAAFGGENGTVSVLIVHFDAFECDRRVWERKGTVGSKDARGYTSARQPLKNGSRRVFLLIGGNACIPTLSAPTPQVHTDETKSEYT